MKAVYIGLGALALATFAGLATAHPAHAAGGSFAIALGGRVSALQTTTDAQGHKTVSLTDVLHSNAGQLPNVTLQLDLTITGANQRVSGAATLSDPTQTTTIFTAHAQGSENAQGIIRYQLAQPQAGSGNGGALTWQGAIATAKAGDLAATAQGSLTLPNGLAPSLISTIWPGASSQSSPVDPSLWYLTRGAAAAAYLLLAATTALGIGIPTRAFDSVSRRARVLDLHQVLTLLMLAFVALHLITLTLDPFLSFSLVNLAWPIGEPYLPVQVTLGVIGLYALAVVTVSSWLRQFISYQTWRVLHYISAVAFIALTLHGILVGTDTATPWMLATYATSTLAIIALVALRVATRRPSRRVQLDHVVS